MRALRAAAGCALLLGALAVTASPAGGQTTTSTTEANCAHPRQLEAMGRPAEARAAYLAILKEHPANAACAAAGLAAMTDDPCASADVLRAKGRHEEATKAYAAILEQQPGSTCAKAGLEPDLGQKVKTWQQDVATALAAGALTLAAALVALWLLLHTARVPGVRRLLRRVPPLRRMLRHRFSFGQFDDSAVPAGGKCAAPLGMLVRAEVLRASASTMEAPGGESALTTTLDGLKELGDQFKLAAAVGHLVERTLPIERFAMNGAMTWGRRGAGMTLSVERADEPPSGGEVWQRLTGEPPAAAAPAPDDFYELVPQAAGWITFELGRRLAPRQWVVASSAESYALARAGIVLKDRADLGRSRAFFERALELDPENVTAWSNLALVEAAEERPADAVQHLERALAILERKLA